MILDITSVYFSSRDENFSLNSSRNFS